MFEKVLTNEHMFDKIKTEQMFDILLYFYWRYVIMRNINKKKKKRLRYVPFVVLFLLVSMVLVFTCQALGNDKEAKKRPVAEVIVQPGDNLWYLIKEYMPDYKGSMDKAVYEIKQFNQLATVSLTPGQVLYIPLDI